MEIRDQGIGGLELVAGIDKDRGFGRHGMEDAVFIRSTLENAAGRCSHGDNATAKGAAAIDLVRHLFGDDEMLRVHEMLLDAIHLHGAERAETDVQGHLAVTNALFLQGGKKLLCEMQARGGGGGRAFGFGIDGLIIVFILQLFGDVGRKGHLPNNVKHLVNAFIFFAVIVKGNDAVAPLDDLFYRGGQNTAKGKGGTDLGFLSGADEGFKAKILMHAKEKQLHCAAVFRFAKQARGNDLRGIHHEHILGANIVDNITEDLMRYRAAFAIQDHQAAFIALFGGGLRDQALGKLVKEIMGGKIGFRADIGDLLCVFFHIA